MSDPAGPKRLRLPVSEADIRAFSVGDIVLLDGPVTITAGLPTCQRIVAELRAGRPLPIDLESGALLHMDGQARDGDAGPEILYMNPTTSTRFNALMPDIIRLARLRITGGKGGLDAENVSAMREQGCVYLAFLGGGCALLSHAIREVEAVGWPELTPHYRLTRLRVEGLGPAIVAIDARGNSLYAAAADAAVTSMPKILADLEADRAIAEAR